LITKKVCDSDKIKAVADSCEVQLVDAEKQIGKILITTKKETKLDIEQVKAELKNAGDDYKLTKIEIKDMVKNELAESNNAVKTAETVTTTTTTTTETTVTDASGKTKIESKTEKKIKKVKKMAKKTESKEERANNTNPSATANDNSKKDTKVETK
jgi:hypothetical protein